ncbi:patatin [Scytonema sp. HK-05]|uniref:patatin-like phospholipase family protein n=1 Tax=Scytonema sp. HK-05 TaxID=1137095 RepID=UPI0009379F4F|nr:patatin-like phospholipase family protein [Scytonema sp. HK-05]OKH57178.1 hypothetical protein NIES2130_20995 [Scytonema sp. HK-05]BAY46706.1 patatin [Scytonema sp. HK-05]
MILNEHQKRLILEYFNPAKPVTTPTNLKGREQELKEGIDYLLSGDCIIIQGSRRTGKTSLLHCLRALCLERNQRCAYISFQSIENYDSKTFVHHLILELFSALKVENINSEECRLHTSLKKLGRAIETKFEENPYIVVFIDEFQATQELTPTERTIFYNQLRNVIDERAIHPELNKFVFVISTSQSLSELSKGTSSTLASAFTKTFILRNISRSSCKELIQQPFSNIIKIEDEIIRLITEETCGNPYILKLWIYTTLIANSSVFFSNSTTYNIQELFEIQLKTLVEDLSHPHFTMLTNGLNNVELEILYEINKYTKMSVKNIYNGYLTNGKTIDIPSIREALKKIENLQIIYKDNNYEICFSNKIYEKWFTFFFKDYNEKSPSNKEADSSLALIMKGGGVKGLAYVGALKELLRESYNFNWFIGTSAGAIAAVLLGAGFTLDELTRLLSEKNYRDFLDAKWYQWPTNFIFYGGLFPGVKFTDWIDKLLAEKLNSPGPVKLCDLPYRVTIYASRRGKDALVFDSYNPESKNTPAAYAVRCSMSIPFIFVPQREAGLRVFDGGMQNNYPVRILLGDNPGLKFVGLYLGAEHYEGQGKEGWVVSDLLSIWTESSDVEALRLYQTQTVIIDPRPISTVDFGLADHEKKFLLKTGRLAALKFLRKRGLIKNDNEVESEQEQVRLERDTLTIRRRKQRQQRIIIVVAILLIIVIFIVWNFLTH